MTGNKCKIEASISAAVLNVEVANFTTKHYDPNIPTKHNSVLRYNATSNEDVPKLSIFIGLGEGFRSIVNQKISYGCEQEKQDLI
jgi:hypothetical protein